MTSQIQGLNQAQRNANDGISVAQTAEGALNQVNDNLQRVRELTVQAANSTNSPDDLNSIQAEIEQRLGEINRISEQTDFNGVKVLSSDQGLKIQVGANDSEAITVNLQQINRSSLGLSGFNVNGSGVSQNDKATVTNITANGGGTTATPGVYEVDTQFEAATFDDVLGKMQTGNKVNTDASGTAVVYTYDAVADNFTYTSENAVADGTAGGTFATDQGLVPASGTKTGTYQIAGGDIATFEITSTGSVTLDGKAAYITATGELSNNDGGGTAATVGLLFAASADLANSTITVGGTTYTGSGSGEISYEAKATAAEVKTVVDASTLASNIVLGDGFASATVTFTAGSLESDNTYTDADGELTNIEGYTTQYNVDADTGEVTVSGVYDYQDTSSTADVDGSKYDEEVGAAVYVSGGKLTTSPTTAGDATVDPLATLDAALKVVDTLRSDLGAIQNRFESAITNLQTNSTNLQAARSRIEDADYAVEVANMSKNQILQQAGTSVLAQANQIPQGVLSLLR